MTKPEVDSCWDRNMGHISDLIWNHFGELKFCVQCNNAEAVSVVDAVTTAAAAAADAMTTNNDMRKFTIQ